MLKKAGLCIVMMVIFVSYNVTAARESAGYLYGGSIGSYINSVEDSRGSINTVIPDFFGITESGELILNFSREDIIVFVDAMHTKGIKITPRLSNDCDRIKGEKALDNYEVISSQIIKTVTDLNLDGVHIDIESLDETYKERYTKFVKRVSSGIKENSKIITMAVASNPMDWKIGWHGSYDYKSLSDMVDYIVILTFDEHYYGSLAGAISGKKFFEDSIEYAVSQGVSKDKIVVGLPFFGRYWNQNESGVAISARDIEYLINNYDAEVKYDKVSESCNVKLTINQDNPKPKIWGGRILDTGVYNIWYDNITALKFKLDYVKNYDIKGICCWALGQENKDIWNFYNDVLNGENVRKESDADDNLLIKEASGNGGIGQAVRGFDIKSILSKFSDEDYSDEDNITLAQLAVIILEVAGTNEVKNENQQISEDQLVEEYLSFLAEKNIIYNTDNYKDKKITRAQMCTVLERILNLPNTIDFHSIDFADLPKDHWAYSSISKMYYFGIINGCEGNIFRPDEYISAKEVSDIFTRAVTVKGYKVNLERLAQYTYDVDENSVKDIPIINPR